MQILVKARNVGTCHKKIIIIIIMLEPVSNINLLYMMIDRTKVYSPHPTGTNLYKIEGQR